MQRKEESANLGDTFGGQFGSGVVAPLCQYDGEHGMGAGGGLVHVGGGDCPVGVRERRGSEVWDASKSAGSSLSNFSSTPLREQII